MLLPQFPLTVHQIHNWMPCFMAKLMTILVLIGTVFVIILEMFHGRISLNSVLLQLLVNFMNMFRLELIYISLVVSISQASLISMVFSCCAAAIVHKITFFVCTNRINLLNLK